MASQMTSSSASYQKKMLKNFVIPKINSNFAADLVRGGSKKRCERSIHLAEKPV